VLETAQSSYDKSPKLFSRTFSEVRTVLVEGEETGAFPIEMPRFRRVMKAIAYAMYYRDFGKRHDGDFELFSPSLNSRANLYRGEPDGFEKLRRIFESRVFKSMPVTQPKVFKYGIFYLDEGQIHYRFEFYEAFIVDAWTLPVKLNRYIYLPVTRDGTLWMVSRD
jgi:hypothetical protein